MMVKNIGQLWVLWPLIDSLTVLLSFARVLGLNNLCAESRAKLKIKNFLHNLSNW